MTNQTLEQRIRAAVEHTAPDQLDSILSSCRPQNGIAGASPCPEHEETQKKGVIISMEEVKNKWTKKKSALTAVAAAAAIFVLCAAGFALAPRGASATADSIVMLDVNPSLSLAVDADETVVSAEALNADAEAVLGSMELEGTSLEVAVNAIVGSMLQKGYLNDTQNSILVSVENEDTARGEELQEKVSAIIASAMQAGTLDVAILSQNVSADDAALAALAQEYGISLGKAALIQEVIAGDLSLSFEDLAPMTINEIALIAASKDLTTESVSQDGVASDKAYISQAEALDIAYTHAGVNAADVLKSEVEFDSKKGVMIYDVEFETASKKGEYEIDAATGEILEYELNPNGSGSGSAASYIGEAAAKEAALTHAGIDAADILRIETQLDREDGVMIYKVEFETDVQKGEYRIDALTGEILRYELHDKSTGSSSSSGPSDPSGPSNSSSPSDPSGPSNSSGSGSENADYFGWQAAEDAALADAGVSRSSTYFITADVGYSNGKPAYYWVKFAAGHTTYVYQLDLYSGAIINSNAYGEHSDHHGGGDWQH